LASPDATALLRSNLNDFLFANVGLEARGMTLSVISVLARQGLDPWQEAGRLADLPNAEATDSLARTIAGMPQSLWNITDATVIARRLTGMLPGRSPKDAAASPATSKASWLPSPKTAMILVSTAFVAAYVVSIMMR
jgi:hypothetical protein